MTIIYNTTVYIFMKGFKPLDYRIAKAKKLSVF